MMPSPRQSGFGQTTAAPPKQNYVDRPHCYVFEYDNIGANATVTGLYQLIDNDSDFFWRSTLASSTNNQFFGVRFQDPNGYYLSDSFISGFTLSSQYIGQPFPNLPGLFCPAGSKIVIDLQDQSGLGNSILLNFWGVKRYYI